MNNDKYTVEQIETLGVRCKFHSMGAERDGWIMPDGVGVDYAGYAQLKFEPDTIKTDNAEGLFLARCAVAEQRFASTDFGYVYTESEAWFEENDTLIKVCYANQDGNRLQLEVSVSFVKGSAIASSVRAFNVTEALAEDENWEPMYSKWRHGGWYVLNITYPKGGCGCVSNNYEDKNWRIACDERRNNLGEPGDFTFKSRGEAAHAERALIRQMVLEIQAKRASLKAAA